MAQADIRLQMGTHFDGKWVSQRKKRNETGKVWSDAGADPERRETRKTINLFL